MTTTEKMDSNSDMEDLQQNANRLLKLLQENDSAIFAENMACAECEDEMADYVHASLVGKEDDPHWQAYRSHIKGCPHCLAIFNELLEMSMAASRPNQEEGLLEIARPDLSFLRRSKVQPTVAKNESGMHSYLNEFSVLIIEFGKQILSSLESPKPLGVKSAGTHELMKLEIPETDSGVKGKITIVEQGSNVHLCDLLVELESRNRGTWPNLQGMEVLLRGDNQTKRYVTDAFGKVAIVNIPIDQLSATQLEINSSQ